MARIRNKFVIPQLYAKRFLWNATAILTISPTLFAQTPVASPATTQSVQQILQQVHSASPSAAGATAPSSVGIAPEGIANLKLRPGSMIAVHVYEEPDLDGSYRLDDHGDIAIPAVGSIPIGALSLREAENAIDNSLIQKGILTEAHVVVNLVDYAARYIAVSGEVSAPGRFPVIGPRKLGDVLAMAGGMTAVAGNEIVLTRGGQSEQAPSIIHYKRNQGSSPDLDTLINPGDSVFVKRAGIVYVFGAVYRPGGYIMQDDGSLNVAGAISMASGTSHEAAISRVRILRKAPDGSWITFRTPLSKIQKGEMPPPELQPGDIVYVPPSLLKEAGINAQVIAGGVGAAIIYRVP